MVAVLTASADIAALPACTYLRASLDLRVTLPKECRWGSKAMITRAFGWHFLNGRLKLSWKEFHRKVKDQRTKYHWQLHHTNEDPSRTLAERLQIVNPPIKLLLRLAIPSRRCRANRVPSKSIHQAFHTARDVS